MTAKMPVLLNGNVEGYGQYHVPARNRAKLAA